MALKARDLMTSEPAFCTPETPVGCGNSDCVE
jgi:hypothetical protein